LTIDAQSLDNAISVLDRTIYTPVFQRKLAAAGIVPQNQEELIELLQLGHVLHDKVAAQQTKQAGDRVSQLRQLRESLTGQTTQPAQQFADFGKQAAADPTIADAILHVLAAQSQAA
jgi:hypothetical protein